MLKKIIWANFQRIIELFTQKNSIVTKLKNMGLGSEIRDPEKKPILDPGSRGQKSTGCQIPDPDPQHWYLQPSSQQEYPYPDPRRMNSTDYAECPYLRVHTEWQLPLSGVHSIMMGKLAQAGAGGRYSRPSSHLPI
jgi:hypothetical protein